MAKEKLQTLLSELNQELESGAEIDPATKNALRSTLDDIETAIGDDENDVPVIAELQVQLSEGVTEFQAEHPRVARIMGEIIDTLAKIGI